MNEKVKKSIRYDEIDIVKVVSAFMITFYHFQCLNFGFTAGVPYYPNLARLLTNCCVISVPLFFMANGAILMNRNYSIKQIAMKIFRIAFLILIWFWLPFPYWFFRTLIILYIMYPVFKKIYDSHRFLLVCLMSLVFLFPFCFNFITTAIKLLPEPILVSVFSKGINLTELPNTGFFTMYAVLYFLLGGILLQKRIPIGISVLLIFLGFTLCTAEGIICTNYYGTVFDGVNSSFPTVGALLMSVGVFDILLRIKPFDRNTNWYQLFRLCSENVLSIYLFHLFIVIRFRSLLPQPTYPVAVILVFSLFIDIACILIGYFIKKIPYLRTVVSM